MNGIGKTAWVLTAVCLASAAISRADAGSASSRAVAGSVRVTLVRAAEGHEFSPLHFGANCEYHRAGMFYGTLPAEDVRSKRREFASVLRRSGLRSLRFPGGNCSYWYLYDSEETTRRLTAALKLGTYAPKNFQNRFFTPLDQFLGFCRDVGIEPIVQLPTMFYNDAGRPWAILPSAYSKRCPDLYDRDRLAEGAEYVRKMAAWTRSRGLEVRHWELGNEEFAHVDVDRYARLALAYSAAIRSVFPQAELYVPMQGWSDKLLDRLKAGGLDASNLILTTHYPFGNWFGQPKHVDTTDPANYLMADMGIDKNFAAARLGLQQKGWAGARVGVTETSVIRFPHPGEHAWDPFAIIPSYAHGLAFAYNWSVMIGQPDCVGATFHDLESTYFGIMKYDVAYNRSQKRFVWIRPDQTERPSDVPPECWFAQQYVISPTALAMGMLAELSGGCLLNVRVQGDAGAFGKHQIHVIAALKSKERALVVVALNRTAAPLPIEISSSPDLPKVAAWRGRVMTARGLRSVLPGDVKTRTIDVRGSALGIDVPPYALCVLTGSGGA